MRFNSVLMAASLALNAYAFSTHAQTQVHPIAVVIRPGFYEKILQRLNKTGETFAFQYCLPNKYFLVGRVSATWAGTGWYPVAPKDAVESLDISARVKNLEIKGMAYDRCPGPNEELDSKSRSSLGPYEAKIADTTLRLSARNIVDMTKLQDIRISADNPNALQISLKQSPKIEKLLNSQREALYQYLVEKAQDELREWIHTQLRGLSFEEPIRKAMPDSPLWKDGPIISKGAITLEFDRPRVARDIVFALQPAPSTNVVLNRESVALYFHASFHKMQGEMKLGSDLALLPLRPSPHDISLVVPESLINDALASIYKEGLLRFITRINLSEQMKSLSGLHAPDVFTVLRIASQAAPLLQFELDRLNLDVKNYSLAIGTHMEDRIIPSTEIMTQAAVSASLAVNKENQTINMVLDPNRFSLEISDLNERLGPAEIAVFKKVANGLWREFLTHNPELTLFSTPIRVANTSLRPQKARVEGKAVVLDFDLGESGAAP